jgi:hypothetical protein
MNRAGTVAVKNVKYKKPITAKHLKIGKVKSVKAGIGATNPAQG